MVAEALAEAQPGLGLLVADEVSKTFGGVQALQQVTLGIPEGGIVGLIGPNGSGKTTLLNCLSGVVMPSSGTIRLDSLAVAGWRPEHFAAAGVVRTFQNIRLFGHLTVLQNVEVCALAASGLRRSAAHELAVSLLAEFGVRELADRYAATLSYGDQRRVEIARALAARPRFLLLDEPAAGMNELESDALAGSLMRVREQMGCGALIVEHNLRLVMGVCEQVFVLNEGRLISQGRAEEVRSDPAVVAAYVGNSLEAGQGGRSDSG